MAVTIVDRVIDLIVTKGELKPGAVHAIDLCAERGLALAVASSSQYRLIDAALGHFDLRDRFALIHSAEDEDYGKPHPAVFLTAAAKLGAAAAAVPRVGGRAGGRAGGQGGVHGLHRGARARRGRTIPPSAWPTSSSTRCSRWTARRSTRWRAATPATPPPAAPPPTADPLIV